MIEVDLIQGLHEISSNSATDFFKTSKTSEFVVVLARA